MRLNHDKGFVNIYSSVTYLVKTKYITSENNPTGNTFYKKKEFSKTVINK